MYPGGTGISQLLQDSRYGKTVESASVSWRNLLFFSSPKRRIWLWGLPTFLFHGYRRLLHGSEAAGEWIWPLTSI